MTSKLDLEKLKEVRAVLEERMEQSLRQIGGVLWTIGNTDTVGTTLGCGKGVAAGNHTGPEVTKNGIRVS